MGFHHNTTIVTEGLSYYYDAADINSVPLTATASGTHDIVDISRTHPSGSTETDAQLSGSGVIGDKWLNFSGDNMDLGYNSGFQPADTGKMYQTVELWYRFFSVKGSCCDTLFGRYHFRLFQIGTTLYFMHGIVDNGTGRYQHPTIAVTAGQWYHVVITRERDSDDGINYFRWYVNNVRQFEQAYYPDANLWNYLAQDYHISTDNHPNLDIAIARMYNRGFSRSEVHRNFNAQRHRFEI